MNNYNWKYSYTQPYFPEGKYNRLYQAQRIINFHNDLITLDKLEPITNVTEAQNILNQYTLKK